VPVSISVLYYGIPRLLLVSFITSAPAGGIVIRHVCLFVCSFVNSWRQQWQATGGRTSLRAPGGACTLLVYLFMFRGRLEAHEHIHQEKHFREIKTHGNVKKEHCTNALKR